MLLCSAHLCECWEVRKVHKWRVLAMSVFEYFQCNSTGESSDGSDGSIISHLCVPILFKSHMLWGLSEWRNLFISRYLQLCSWLDWEHLQWRFVECMHVIEQDSPPVECSKHYSFPAIKRMYKCRNGNQDKIRTLQTAASAGYMHVDTGSRLPLCHLKVTYMIPEAGFAVLFLHVVATI